VNQQFSVGEVAILATNGQAGKIGDEVTITRIDMDFYPGEASYETDKIGFYGQYIMCEASDLRKKRPPAREDQQLTTWDMVVWRPTKVTT